ncbi:META domain-containing protein [Paracoccus sp. (in: a-proteobacteria)]|uniref:META domain-containing protein n=1 Tax=Paracoccus sp. TaxID=267 RepID=UPI00272B5C75|nr:META domain-containing protein [Paracoccus sp. (in: a-proteobacteria)]
MFRLSLPLLAAVAALAACRTPAPAPTPFALESGQRFAVTQIEGQPAPADVTLEVVEAGRLAGQGPCNRWFANFNQDGAILRIGPAGATRMACLDEARMDAENGFFAALEDVDGITAGDGDEVALTKAGKPRITLRAAP